MLASIFISKTTLAFMSNNFFLHQIGFLTVYLLEICLGLKMLFVSILLLYHQRYQLKIFLMLYNKLKFQCINIFVCAKVDVQNFATSNLNIMNFIYFSVNVTVLTKRFQFRLNHIHNSNKCNNTIFFFIYNFILSFLLFRQKVNCLRVVL